jgi:ribose 5-phosphate isomerase A
VADHSKLAARLGNGPIPLEIPPFAQAFVELRVRSLGGTPLFRRTASGAPFQTDQANFVLDAVFDPIGDLEGLATALDTCPGIFAHGLFLQEIDALYVAGPAGVSRRERLSAEPI